MSVESLVNAVGVAVIAGAVFVLLYTRIRYRAHLLHRPAFGLLVGAAVCYAGSFGLDSLGAAPFARESLQLLAALLYVWAVWEFAGSFLHFETGGDADEGQPDISLSAEGGGFDDGE